MSDCGYGCPCSLHDSPIRAMTQPTPPADRFAHDCACVVKYFPESRTDAIYFCPLHAQAPAMREALEELCASVAPDRFGSGRPIWYDRARAILKAIAP